MEAAFDESDCLVIKTTYRVWKKEKDGKLPWAKGQLVVVVSVGPQLSPQLSCHSQISMNSGRRVKLGEECFHVAA